MDSRHRNSTSMPRQGSSPDSHSSRHGAEPRSNAAVRGRHDYRDEEPLLGTASAPRSIPTTRDNPDYARHTPREANSLDSDEDAVNAKRSYLYSSSAGSGRHEVAPSLGDPTGRSGKAGIKEIDFGRISRHDESERAINAEEPSSARARARRLERTASDEVLGGSGVGDRHGRLQHPTPSPSISRSPPTSYPSRGFNLDSRLAGLDISSQDTLAGRPERTVSTRRRPSNASSLGELARNDFDFDGLILTDSVRISVKATVDTGCHWNIILSSVINKADINPGTIQVVTGGPSFEGFQGHKYSFTRKLQLTWGKAKHNGKKTLNEEFYIVEKLPDDLEMIIGCSYLRNEIERAVKRDPSGRG